MLGSTFDYVFKLQMENLQDGDRLYYLPRIEGTDFSDQIENSSFAEIIMNNTGVKHLSASVFLTPEFTIEADKYYMHKADGSIQTDDNGNIVYDPAVPMPTFTGSDGAPHQLMEIIGGETLTTAKTLLDGTVLAAGTTVGGTLHFLGEDNFFGNTMVLGGTAGNDSLMAGQADDDTVYGDAGNDIIDGGGGNDNLFGGDGNDILSNTNSSIGTVFHGDAGDDTIYGSKGDDTILGGDGNDLIYGGQGIDDIVGGTGNDIIFGGEGGEEIQGDQGRRLDRRRPGRRRRAHGRRRRADRRLPALCGQRRVDWPQRLGHEGVQRRRHHGRNRRLHQVRRRPRLRLGLVRDRDRRCQHRHEPQGVHCGARTGRWRRHPRSLSAHGSDQRLGVRRHHPWRQQGARGHRQELARQPDVDQGAGGREQRHDRRRRRRGRAGDHERQLLLPGTGYCDCLWRSGRDRRLRRRQHPAWWRRQRHHHWRQRQRHHRRRWLAACRITAEQPGRRRPRQPDPARNPLRHHD